MSASLVGSEMCIRDSPRGAGRLRTSRLLDSGGGPSIGAWFLQRGATVSYTHLTLPTICSV
eukprot:7015519-Alexandrium_andersonii.AAC.1